MRGSIPSGIGNLTTLQVLSARSCGLHGTVPIAIGGLHGLQELSLGSNLLVGQVPDTSAMASLTILSLENNSFTGPIPEYLGFQAESQLRYLLLSKNRLSSTVGQRMLSRLTGLRMLLLDSNGPTLSSATAI